MLRLLSAIFVGMFLLTSGSKAQDALPSIEAYGQLPAISLVSLSPNGDYIAFVYRNGEKNELRIINLVDPSEQTLAIDVDQIKVNGVSWADENHVILRAYETTRITGFRGKLDYSAAFSVNRKTRKLTKLLIDTDKLYPGQSGLGSIVASEAGTEKVFMPAYMGTRSRDPVYSILKVDLDTGRGRVHYRGNENTADWFIDTDGTILAREDYNNRSNEYQISTKQGGKWKTVLERIAENGPAGLVGVTPDRSALVVLVRNSDGYNEIRRLGFDGTYSDAIMARDNTEIERVMLTSDRIVFGVAYGGLQPSYDFFDKDLAADVKAFQDKVKTASISLVSWSADFSKLVFYIEGSTYAGDYLLMDRATSDISYISSARPDIKGKNIGEVLTIEYAASDGLKIPGVMTVPFGSDLKKLPAIIMPHGGPEAHDKVAFDWIAQYFASRGYLVFQPNFRGSDGFGTAFTKAGYGGWGGVMQQDITDGVAALDKGGMIDPERVCIVGWSYGGYAALAGGAFTPDLYKCVAAIAPVSDLPRMLIDEKRDHGKDHWVVSYWEKAMANGDATRDTLREKSPVEFADRFTAPVLLIHGRDDLVVKINQSKRMRSALKKAGKDVELIEMRGEDHYLITPGSRLAALQALDGFIAENIGPHNTK